MPELPEVETIARQLHAVFIGQTVSALWCNWPRMLSPRRAELHRRVRGAAVTGITRRAKFLVWHFDRGGVLLIHLRMSGRPLVVRRGERPGKHVHFILRFTAGPEMHLEDTRKFARASWAADADPATRDLGIEPLGPQFTPDWLADALGRRSRQLKPALLDQRLIAGLGNIYTDEALFRAGLHPLRKTDSLRDPEVARLHAAIIEVLRAAIRHNGASLDWVYPDGEMQDHFQAYGRTGQPCVRCGTAIRRLVVGQRGTHVCPRCQRGR